MRETVILLGGNIISYGVIRGIKNKNADIIVFKNNSNDFAQYSKYVKKSHKIVDPNIDEDKYIKTLLEYGEQYKGALLIPVNDDTLLAVSKYKKELSEFYNVFAPNWESLEIFIDKEKTYKLCKELNIPHPKTFYPKNLDELEEIKDQIVYPYIIKPCISHKFVRDFNVKLFKADNFEDLKEKFQLSVTRGHKVLVQKYIEHADDKTIANITYHDKNGKYKESFQCKKLRLNPPGKGVSRISTQIKQNKNLEFFTKKILDNVNYRGVAVTDFLYDKKDGKYKLMEINARFFRSHLFAVYCGINFSEMVYDDYFHDKIKKYKVSKENAYWIDFYADLLNSLTRFPQEDVKFKDYFKPYFAKNKVFAVSNKKDPLPFTMMMLNLPLKYGRILKRFGKRKLTK